MSQIFFNKKSSVFELTSVASRLAQAKEFLRVTSKQLAESAGVSEQTFSAWLKGKNPPSAEALAAWMIAYNLNINWLLTGEGEMFRITKTEVPTKLADVADPTAPALAARVRELEAENLRLKDDLLASKDETLALYRRQHDSGHYNAFIDPAG